MTISPLPDSPGLLLTSLNQFPIFYEYSATPAVTFNNFVTTAVCLRDNFSIVTPRIAHNIGTTFGAVEVLPAASATGVVDCADLPVVIGARWYFTRICSLCSKPPLARITPRRARISRGSADSDAVVSET